ncbi:Elongation factor P [Camellia lanceoleosa]|uniref:Elongation factor P n=1 Tax=Camellia lanceoleosa TaxID=1840588 RepID=A0ACC0F0F9_9ERIC|nr:Elongation factor P [Camellia lanceoleosa]
MRVWSKQVSRALYSIVATSPSSFAISSSSSSSSCSLIARALTTWRRSHPLIQSPHHAFGAVLESPWSATQLRGAKFRGSDVKPGNVIERKGKIYQVVKAQHTVQGRGGACIQVELRDIDSGNKINERLRTDEAIEKVFVEEKPYTYLYTEDNFVVLAEPKTYDQLDVPKDLFGEAAVYLKDNMTVTVQLYDERPMSASVPQRVTCKVVEAQVPMKGIAATPHYKKVLLDNGLTVQVPAHVLAGDQIVINTFDNSYITRA